MTITPFHMYLIMKLDSVDTLITVMVFIMLLTLIVLLVLLGNNYDYSEKEGSAYWNYWKKWFITTTILIPLLSAINAALPSTKEIAIILTAPAIINNEDVQALPAELIQLARKEVQEMLKPVESNK